MGRIELTVDRLLAAMDHPMKPELERLRAIVLGADPEITEQVKRAAYEIIERKGAKTALLTTKGFRDILETGKELRYDLYDIFIEFPQPLVPRRLRLVVGERTRYDGRVIEELGTYDPHVADNDKNVTLIADRVRYWQSVGARASDKVTVLLNKFLARADAQAAAPPAEGEKKA